MRILIRMGIAALAVGAALLAGTAAQAEVTPVATQVTEQSYNAQRGWEYENWYWNWVDCKDRGESLVRKGKALDYDCRKSPYPMTYYLYILK